MPTCFNGSSTRVLCIQCIIIHEFICSLWCHLQCDSFYKIRYQCLAVRICWQSSDICQQKIMVCTAKIPLGLPACENKLPILRSYAILRLKPLLHKECPFSTTLLPSLTQKTIQQTTLSNFERFFFLHCSLLFVHIYGHSSSSQMLPFHLMVCYVILFYFLLALSILCSLKWRNVITSLYECFKLHENLCDEGKKHTHTHIK